MYCGCCGWTLLATAADTVPFCFRLNPEASSGKCLRLDEAVCMHLLQMYSGCCGPTAADTVPFIFRLARVHEKHNST